MTIIDKLNKTLPLVISKGNGEAHEIQELFNIYNEHRVEITGDPNIKRETAIFCSGCVNRVITRLKKYYDTNKDINL